MSNITLDQLKEARKGSEKSIDNIFLYFSNFFSTCRNEYFYLSTNMYELFNRKVLINFINEYNSVSSDDFVSDFELEHSKLMKQYIGEYINEGNIDILNNIIYKTKNNQLNVLCKYLIDFDYNWNVNLTIKIINDNEKLSDDIANLISKKSDLEIDDDSLLVDLKVHFIRTYKIINNLDCLNYDEINKVNLDFFKQDFGKSENVMLNDDTFEIFNRIEKEKITNIADIYKKKKDKEFSFNDYLFSGVSGLNYYFKCLRSLNIKLLTHEEEIELGKKIEKGDKDARETLILNNLRLVVWLAKKRNKISCLPYEEIIQDGNYGLVLATYHWDWRKGYRFNTYASECIRRQMIKGHHYNKSQLRLPQNAFSLYLEIKKTIDEYQDKYYKDISLNELSSIFNISPFIIQNILSFQENLLSLDFQYDDGLNRLELIMDSNIDVENEAMLSTLHNELENLFIKGDISKRNIIFLKLHFGYFNNKCYKFADIAKMFNISSSSVQQDIHRTLRKLRNIADINAFMGYLNDISYTADDYMNEHEKKPDPKNIMDTNLFEVLKLDDEYENLILDIISNIKDEYKKIIYSKCGSDLRGTNCRNISNEEIGMYYSVIIPFVKSMVRILKQDFETHNTESYEKKLKFYTN